MLYCVREETPLTRPSERVNALVSILSCASGMGSPTNHLGSGQRQGSFGLLTGGLNLTPPKKRTDRTLDPFYLGRVSLARHNILSYYNLSLPSICVFVCSGSTPWIFNRSGPNCTWTIILFIRQTCIVV